ncbi:MAG: VOC family protein [Chloroflexota bacterium]
MKQQSNNQLDLASRSIHPDTRIGIVTLTVSELSTSIPYYVEAVGFELLKQDSQSAVLGAGGVPLLYLTEQKGAQAWPRGGISYTGLYHFAILLPTRGDLGRWLQHWFEVGMPMPGQGDHLVSEALYLEDPDGHGIEVYQDRPRSEWRFVNGQIQMAADPVDLEGLLDEAIREDKAWTGLPKGTKVGHIHLQVADIAASRDFYNGILGFDVMADLEHMGALFLSAGGYHHHLGMNTWHSKGRSAAPEGSVGLQHFTVLLPDQAALDEVTARLQAADVPYETAQDGILVRDPANNRILLMVDSAS